MIGYLTGNVIKKYSRQLLVEVNGVGYLVYVPNEILEKAETGNKSSLFIHTVVREDDISLYGFETAEALQFFELLLTVTRVGPKLGLDIMNISISKVKMAIMKKDVGFLASISGVGKKTAERVILELRDKITLEPLIEGMEITDGEAHEDVTQALMKLGYDRRHVSQVLHDLPKEIEREEEIIKYFLKNA